MIISSREEGETVLPETYGISQNYPNPFNPETEIFYQLPEENRVTIQIFNLTGQLVKTLIDENQGAGYYSTQWDGRNDRNGRVPSGVYICKMKAGQYAGIKKMILIK